jgi:REP element-mobilizing transposase RayT
VSRRVTVKNHGKHEQRGTVGTPTGPLPAMPSRYDPERHHRRSIRLQGYPYTRPGIYFLTICTYRRICLFGQVHNGRLVHNRFGEVAVACWREIPVHFPHVRLDAFVVMPNHVHGLLIIPDRIPEPVPEQEERFGRPVAGSIPTIVRSYKAAVTARINRLRRTPGTPVWQRNYYEHIVRNRRALEAIRRYIAENPARWQQDRYFIS